ncbi:unnamed protein product [Gongylonema pulchrum]|uniref:Secreted protein n=1 Tax=Gongylonema pulchrum TaxID=637853 RepID=A0A183CYP5_9BILA|nr:unnamed protein product [Gongylonema pulchrum]
MNGVVIAPAAAVSTKSSDCWKEQHSLPPVASMGCSGNNTVVNSILSSPKTGTYSLRYIPYENPHKP